MRGRDARNMARIFEDSARLARKRGDEDEARYAERQAAIWREFGATDWSAPNPENGFYPGKAAAPPGYDPEAWDHSRRMTALELLRGHLFGHYGGTLPAFWEPPESNPFGDLVGDADWSELRTEMLSRSREWAADLIEEADKHARTKRSGSVGEVAKFYGRPGPDSRAGFFAASAVDGDLKPEVQARKLDAYAVRARELQELYARLADGLEEGHA